MKYQVLFSLKNNEEIFMNDVCCSCDCHFKGLYHLNFLRTTDPEQCGHSSQVWPPRYLAEHEILNAHKYENIKKFNTFQAQISLECYFSAHNCLNANNCWHFNIYEQEKFHAQLR